MRATAKSFLWKPTGEQSAPVATLQHKCFFMRHTNAGDNSNLRFEWTGCGSDCVHFKTEQAYSAQAYSEL